jgi:hypothetical protein
LPRPTERANDSCGFAARLFTVGRMTATTASSVSLLDHLAGLDDARSDNIVKLWEVSSQK